MPQKRGYMDEDTSFDTTRRETINPLVDEINKSTEPILKVAMKELGYKIPLYVRLYNQIRFYEEYGKLKMGTSVASKETLANQFGVTVEQIEAAFNNLTNKYKLGTWVEHEYPVYRNVKRTWMSNARIGTVTSENYYSVIPELLQRNSKTITAEYLPTDKPPLSESKKKVKETMGDEMGKQVQAIIKLRRQLKWPTPYGGAKKEPQIAQQLLNMDDYAAIVETMKRYEEHRNSEFMPSINNLGDLYHKYRAVKSRLDTLPATIHGETIEEYNKRVLSSGEGSINRFAS